VQDRRTCEERKKVKNFWRDQLPRSRRRSRREIKNCEGEVQQFCVGDVTAGRRSILY
jgi:hypothetical protein